MRDYRKIEAWQLADDLTVAIYQKTQGFPKEELYGVTSQIRRAAVSTPSNIAEGQGRQTETDFRRFLSIAYGSLREAETQVLIAERLRYISAETRAALIQMSEEIGRMLSGLRRSLADKKR